MSIDMTVHSEYARPRYRSSILSANPIGVHITRNLTQWQLILVSSAIVSVLIVFILRLCEGHFTYTLDDPYIHLALARNIFHGHYGINPGEVSAPSSSILWPFLLAPFAAFPGIFEFVPLGLNLICLGASMVVLARLLEGTPRLLLLPCILAMALGFNLFGLVFTGMEHSLQLLLVLLILDKLVRHEDGSRYSPVFYSALALLPLVRYEGLAISVPVLAYVFLKGARRPAIVTALVMLAVMAGFSAFLYGKGLGPLPSSVLAKSTDGGGWHVAGNLVANIVKNPLLIVSAAILIGLVIRRDRLLAGTIASALLLHLAFGKTGWFGRYEAYMVCFVLVLLVRESMPLSRFAWLAMLLVPAYFPQLSLRIVQTPFAAQNIYAQQAQMSRIVALLGQPVAIHDLGLVALRSGQYVLDLYGLASIDALHDRQSGIPDPVWMSRLMAAKHVRFALIYDDWFPQHPQGWVRVASLGLTEPNIISGSDRVSLYAVDPSAVEPLRKALADYNECCATPLAPLRSEASTQ